MYKNFIKRFLDIVISLIALPFVLLTILIFAPIIYFSDKGPVFYNAPRLGRKGKVFKSIGKGKNCKKSKEGCCRKKYKRKKDQW